VGGGGEEPRREWNKGVHTQKHIDAKVPKIEAVVGVELGLGKGNYTVF